jgi:hypothetical protein
LLLRVLVGVVFLLDVFVVASYFLFVAPVTDHPTRVDAILSLDGGDENLREARAIALVEAGYSRVLLFSQGNYRTTPCPAVPNVEVICFEPKPARTVGEVEWATNYARSHGIRSIMVVPSRPQSVRAGLLMRRCFSGTVLVVPASVPRRHLLYDVIYEWGALARALVVDPSC